MKEEQLFEAMRHIDSQFIEENIPLNPKRKYRRFLILTVLFSILAILILMAFLFPMSTYWSYPYTIEKVDDQFYLQLEGDLWGDLFPEPVIFYDKYIYYQLSAIEYTFDSTNEMRDAFYSGKLHRYGGNTLHFMSIESLRVYGTDRYIIPNLDKLYQPVLPEDVSHDGSVTWSRGDAYSFPFSCALSEDSRITLHYYISDDLQYKIDHYASAETYYDPIRGAHINKKEFFRKTTLFYILTLNDREFFIEETLNEDGVIEQILCVTTIDDVTCCVLLNSPSQLPTVQWLSGFDLQPA